MATRATTLCESAGNYEDAGQAYIAWAVSHLFKGEYARAIAKRDDVLRMTERRFNVRWRSRTNVATAIAYWRLGRWADALECGRQALAVCEQNADAVEAAQAAWTLAQVCIDQGDLDHALEYGELAGRSPLPDKRWHMGGLARAWCRIGRHREGLEILSAVTEIFRALKAVPFSELWASWLAEGYWLAGDYTKARQTAESTLEIATRCDMPFEIGAAHRLLGELALAQDPGEAGPVSAAAHFEKSIPILRKIGAENELARAYAGYGRLQARLGRVAAARDSLTQALDIFERLRTLGEPDRVRQWLAELPAA